MQCQGRPQLRQQAGKSFPLSSAGQSHFHIDVKGTAWFAAYAPAAPLRSTPPFCRQLQTTRLSLHQVTIQSQRFNISKDFCIVNWSQCLGIRPKKYWQHPQHWETIKQHEGRNCMVTGDVSWTSLKSNTISLAVMVVLNLSGRVTGLSLLAVLSSRCSAFDKVSGHVLGDTPRAGDRCVKQPKGALVLLLSLPPTLGTGHATQSNSAPDTQSSSTLAVWEQRGNCC